MKNGWSRMKNGMRRINSHWKRPKRPAMNDSTAPEETQEGNPRPAENPNTQGTPEAYRESERWSPLGIAEILSGKELSANHEVTLQDLRPNTVAASVLNAKGVSIGHTFYKERTKTSCSKTYMILKEA